MNWLTMWQRLNLAPDVNVIEELRAAYSQSHRYYHTLQHLRECLDWLDEVQHIIHYPEHIALALYFHDAIYDTYAHDNEIKSAAWVTEVLHASSASPALMTRIQQLIMATQYHIVDQQDHDGQLLVDIDLAILGQNSNRFNEYEQQIKQEYSWVDEEDFKQGRAKVLQSFLDRDWIYQSDYFREKLEQQARLNIQTALVRLNA